MTCPACGHENREGASFCGQCGVALIEATACPQCGASNAGGQQFCDACGHALADSSLRETTVVAAFFDQPTTFAGGRYEVKRFLGEGGKKKVYLAHDTLLDRDVAFALIKTEGLDDAGRTRIQREAQAMGRLGSHPHIVTVFDLGQHPSTVSGQASQPYMVTELMGGGDVEGLIEKAEDHRLSLEQALQITTAVCQGLEFAHGKGIVHRDLKPGNVWLTSDGVAKIGDFGLAVATDRSRLTQEGMMVGTVSYMPPEQAMGGEVTPKADLYSLGAMLYEMVTGRPPFLGDDPIAIIGQHINTPPVAPTWHNKQCPRPLEALVLRLLAKDPAERPESASDVLAALESLDLTAVEETEVGEANVLDSLAGGVFVGRQREMGELKAGLEDALSGRGRLITLVGEPGIGKTRTAMELATYAGMRNAQVLWGRCYESQGAPPYWPWVQAIRSYVREREPDRLKSEMGAGAADIAEIVSEVRQRLPDLEKPPQLEPDEARFRLFDSITTFLKSAAQAQPLVLMLDDLHWADKPSLLLLEFLARELEHSRLLVIGTYRDVEVSRKHPLSQTLGELTRERLFQRVLLRGLIEADVARFIEVAAGVSPPMDLTQAVHTQTEGNPLFVSEVVRLLVQEGDLTSEKLSKKQAWTVRIPEGVRDVIGRRLERLSERCNETLTVASVVGREFELKHLAPLIDDLSQDRLLEVLEEALAARVIEEAPRQVGLYQFTHALIRETLVAELSLTRRVRLHARIAEALEALYGDDAEAHAGELANHLGEAVTILGTERLVHYSLIAGERALSTYAHEEALALFQRALAAREGQPMDDGMADLFHGLGRAQLMMLQVQEGWANLGRAFDWYIDVKNVQLAVAAATFQFLPTYAPAITKDSLGRMERALALAPPDSHEAARLLGHYGVVLGTSSDDAEAALGALADAQVIARREGDRRLEAVVLLNMASTNLFSLDFPQVLDDALAAIELARRTGDPSIEGHSHFLASGALNAMGRFEEARGHSEASVTLAEKHRHPGRSSQALNQRAMLSWAAGDLDDARRLSDRALDLWPKSPLALAPRSLIEYEVGSFEEGEIFLGRLLEAMRDTPPGPFLQHAVTAAVVPVIARITGDSGRFEVAEEAAETMLAQGGVPAIMAVSSSVGLAFMAVERGDISAAKEQYTALESRRGAMLTYAATDRVLGLLSVTMGDLDQAAAHFDEGLAFCRKAGHRPELAWTCCDYADLLRERASTGSAQAGDREQAVALYDESLQIATEVGMRPLMERVLSRKDILGA